METIRELQARDLPELKALSDTAGWNQTLADWSRILELEPQGCFGMECDGRLVATATVICYARELAWVGMVLTHADYRGRGYGTRLTGRAVELARSRGVGTVKLDATDMGWPIYARLGFSDEAPIERYVRSPEAAPLPEPPGGPACAPYAPDPALDAAAFGADRSALLAALAREEALSAGGEGYAMARVGSRAVQIGPCVSRSERAARSLLTALTASHPGETAYWDLLPASSGAVRLAGELGYAPVRRLTRMSLAARPGAVPPAHDDSLVWAAAGFEYG